MRRVVWLTASLLLAHSAAHAQSAHHHHPDAAPAAANASRSTQAYVEAMDEMHAGMDIPYTGNADLDFVNGMIPHHEGAVEMAKIELQYGHDPALKRLAKSIIVGQGKEIRYMKRWRAERPVSR